MYTRLTSWEDKINKEEVILSLRLCETQFWISVSKYSLVWRTTFLDISFISTGSTWTEKCFLLSMNNKGRCSSLSCITFESLCLDVDHITNKTTGIKHARIIKVGLPPWQTPKERTERAQLLQVSPAKLFLVVYAYEWSCFEHLNWFFILHKFIYVLAFLTILGKLTNLLPSHEEEIFFAWKNLPIYLHWVYFSQLPRYLTSFTLLALVNSLSQTHFH